jgi:hypothetical protein
MKLPDNLVALLHEPLPPEAIKPHPTKPYLSSINAIYVTERLNKVFGIGGWKLKVDVLDAGDKMVTVKASFTVPEYGIELEQFGGNDNADKGDALKGATTDALTKIGSYLGIGQDVWKDKKGQQAVTTAPRQERKAATENDFQILLANAPSVKLTSGTMKTGRMWFAGDNYWLTKPQFDDIQQAQIMAFPKKAPDPLPNF